MLGWVQFLDVFNKDQLIGKTRIIRLKYVCLSVCLCVQTRRPTVTEHTDIYHAAIAAGRRIHDVAKLQTCASLDVRVCHNQ